MPQIKRKKKFDAKRYWANKPTCSVCNLKKVKEGTICSECKKKIEIENAEAPALIEETLFDKGNTFLENSGVDVSTEARGKIIRLFSYLEKALSLDDQIARDFRTNSLAPSPWWLDDYPKDLDNLFIRSFDTEREPHDSETHSHVWLRVEKKNIEPAPAVPSRLIEWIGEITPLDNPEPVEKIDRKAGFDSDKNRVREFKEFRKNFEQGDKVPASLIEWVTLSPNKLPEVIEFKYIPDLWVEHPELEKLLSGYTENEWKPWSKKVEKVYKANLLYDQLYALRLLLKNEGDNYELLLGQGVLTWKHKKVNSIYAPIFLTPLVLDFDASKRTIEISPDPMFRSFVEISAVSEMDNPAEVDLDTWMGTINASPFDFWHLEALKSQANTFLNYLSPDSEDRFDDNPTSAPTETETPSIWNSPVIFVRKRTNSLWSKYAEKIRRDIEKNGTKSTEFINDLIGEYKEEDSRALENSETSGETSIKEAELFFPLPWNDEQKRIAERLEINYGVVVKGPPGTGKSHTIANLIARFLAQGKSVLVTSQTSKALEVLRDKLPENIRSLAVSQLNQSAKRDDILQQSISEISSNLGERHTKFKEENSDHVRKELARVREEKAVVANKIRQYILIDSSEKIIIDGEEINPISAAKLISKHSEAKDLSWFTDNIDHDSELNFSTEDLKEAYQLLIDLKPEDRSLHSFNLPDLATLPDESVIAGAFSEFKDLYPKSKNSPAFGSAVTGFNQEALSKLWESVNNARRVLTSINENYEKEIFKLCVSSKSERDKWKTALSKIADRVLVIGKAKQTIIGHEISGSTSLSQHELIDAIKELRAKISDKTRLGTFGKLLLSADAKNILTNYKVDGREPDSKDLIEILDEQIHAEQSEKEIRIILTQSFAGLKDPVSLPSGNLDIVWLEMLVSNLNRISTYYEDFSEIESSFKKIKQLSELSFTLLKDIETARELIASNVAKFELVNLHDRFNEWRMMLEDPNNPNRHPIRTKLVDAIEKHSTAAWKKAVEELELLTENKSYSVRLRDVSEKICKYASNLYQDMVESIDEKQEFIFPENLELAWKVSRLTSWLDHIHSHVGIDELQAQHERLTKKEFQLNSDLVTLVAWQKQIDKVTKKQRDALMAWSDAMKKYGKGTGKYANKWLNSAQTSLKEAKNAVPVWIMPLHRAAQMFSDPQAGMFDVVIFDEASQCDIRGLTIGYLGKKLLVVGDPDQISPAGIFQDQERVFELISRFLHDIPHKDNFSITSSLFSLANIRIPNMIQLNEHFRCVPEVIAFSNHHIYEGKLKPLRHPHPRGLLKPALVPVFIDSGYQNTNSSRNEPEAKAIVEKIAELVEDPNYQLRPDGRLCSFGVISLLAEEQAKYIKDLLLKHPKIGERVIEERNITCGDAYAFQGDERDVIFLSMVKALDPNNPEDTVRPLADKGASQRFNVAATRARDQVFLYHSIPLEEFRNPNDWRYKILNWYYNPKTEELEAGRQALKKEFDSGRASPFSLEVGNILIDREYQVLPEYPVIGYRIDLVVQGENARLAVECDGDQYHTLENWEADQIRERQLRRAGWEFWRVSGSAFYRHKEKALDSLWEKLGELEIYPLVETK